MIKKILNLVTIILLSQFCVSVFAVEPFRFALLTDLHISNKKPQNEVDLKNAVKDVNSQHNIDFVLINGDDTDLGDLESFKIVKKIIDKLKIPYYISVGNHDTNSGETGLANFTSVFGDDTFSFVQHGFRFIGFPTSPLKKGEKAHIPEDDLQFIKHELKKTGKKKSVILMTHYPMLKGDVDNWKDSYNFV